MTANATTTAATAPTKGGSLDLAPAPFATTGDEGIAPVVSALQKVWARLQKAQPDLPDATIVVKRDSRAWGHTTVNRVWGAQATKGRGKAKTVALKDERYEVMISGENLSRGATAVLGTLLHEAAHALNIAREIRDVDVNGRHNKRFAQTAEEAWGLEIKDLGNWMGWTDTYVPEACAKRFGVEVKMIATALTKSTVAHHAAAQTGGTVIIVPPAPGKTKTGGRAKNLSRAVCECAPDASGWRPSLRASAKVLAIGIKCEACDALFTVTGE
jgi:hypothetical protein